MLKKTLGYLGYLIISVINALIAINTADFLAKKYIDPHFKNDVAFFIQALIFTGICVYLSYITEMRLYTRKLIKENNE